MRIRRDPLRALFRAMEQPWNIRSLIWNPDTWERPTNPNVGKWPKNQGGEMTTTSSIRPKRILMMWTACLALPWVGTAHGIDLTGTWAAKDGLVKCTIFAGSKSKGIDANFDPLEITQTGTTIRFRIGTGEVDQYANTYEGLAITNSSDTEKGAAFGTPCERGSTEFYDGAIYLPKATATTTEGKFSFTYQGKYFSNMATCKGKFTRTSATNPNVPACP